jgi:predicted PurR-regulated permease PerM
MTTPSARQVKASERDAQGLTMARMVSFLVLVAILVVIAIVFVRVMAGFFVPLFLAALLGVIVQPLYRWILRRTGGYRYLAASLTTLVVFLIGLLPIGLIITRGTLEGVSLLDRLQVRDVRTKLDDLRSELGLKIPRERDFRRIEASLRRWRADERVGDTPDFDRAAVQNLLDRVASIKAWLIAEGDSAPVVDIEALEQSLIALRDSAPGSVDRDVALLDADAQFKEFKRSLLGGTYNAWLSETANPTDEQIEQLRRQVVSTAGPILSLGGDTLAFVVKLLAGLLIMLVALFFLMAEGSRMLDALVRISPLEEHYVRELVTEFDRACRAIVLATLFSAIAQSILAGIGFYFAGLEASVMLLMLLTMLLALVPVTGAATVWVPVCLYVYLFEGRPGTALMLAVYCAIVVSGSDNVIKPLVLHGQSNLHPLLALLSVLGGLQALGPIGILVGPMAVVFLQVMLRLLQRELSSLDKGSWRLWPSSFGPPVAVGPVPSSPSQFSNSAQPSDGPTAVGPSGNGHEQGMGAPDSELPAAPNKGRK